MKLTFDTQTGQNLSLSYFTLLDQGSVVQRPDSVIHWIVDIDWLGH